MSEPIKEMFELAVASFLFTSALFQLFYSQDLFFKGTEGLPTTETVYFNSHEVKTPTSYWTGAQIVLFLKEADLEETPVQVGGVLFEREYQVEQLWKSINPKDLFTMVPKIDNGDKIARIQFTLAN